MNRCVSLASSLSSAGFKPRVVTNTLPSLLLQKIKTLGFPHETHSGVAAIPSSNCISNHVDKLIPSWLVLDAPGLEFNSLAADHKVRILTFEKDSEITIASGTEQNENEFDLLAGPEFQIATERTHRQLKSRATRILIVMNDETLTAKILETVELANIANVTVDVLLDGSTNSSCTWSETLEQRTTVDVRVHYNLDRIESLKDLSDLAIIDSYDGFLRLASVGIPCLVVDTSDQSNWKNLVAANCVQTIDLRDDKPNIARQIKRFASNLNSRIELANNSCKIVDGLGAERIARAVMASMFRFRPMEIGDADFLLQWRNDPEQRVVCFQQEQISNECHEKWIRARLDSALTQIFIIENEEEKPVGQFRLEFARNYSAVRLHISLVPSLRGFGLGTAFIERVSRMTIRRYPDIEVFAQIKPGNQISQSAFRKAGFEPVATTTINGQVALRFVKVDKLSDANESKSSKKAA